MNVREGLIPTIVGTAVTATGLALVNRRNVNPVIPWSLAAFGAAHVLLGTIDLVEEEER